MKEAIQAAITKCNEKLVRQEHAMNATKAMLDILGDSAREKAKLSRQESAVEATMGEIKKLESALKKLK